MGETMADPTVRRRRTIIRALVGAAAACAAAVPVGHWAARPGGLLALAQTFDHPLLFGRLFLAALTAALLLGVRHVAVRIVVTVPAAAAVLFGGPVSLLLAQSGITKTIQNAPAPGRPDRHLVVEEGAAMIDPIWLVHVDEGTGLATRRWQVAHFKGDDPANALTEAAWAGPDRIRLVTDDGDGGVRTHAIDLSPTTGEPSRTLSRG
ncbi:hypothetical protein J7E88_08525 [Streptomyces sp. ISL-10]|uniref:hypothetical protein n=1 Tax=Streptomyces sp. ISL-10 TaxID=2819172 RepID=UPI001BE99DCB|nr:hypothetical protein [Streptomyces sp. ISL-10]MBT2365367.1 hypothetical protein [Streptomyces sp. ISL-10]